ncbi:MAG: hypothetical protein ACLGI3_10430 [Actinomycetes bacterium]
MALLPLGLLLAMVATLAIGTAVARRSPPSRETAVAAGRRHAVRTAGAAVLLGALAAVHVGAAQLGNVSPGGLGITTLLVPITFGVVHNLVLAAGELTWPRPRSEVRRARLVHRGLLDAAPRRLLRTAVVALPMAAVTLVGGALLADPDGRSFSYRWEAAGGIGRSTASPFPGSFYGIPAGVGLLVLALVTVLALWIVANRPAVATADDAIETALRRASAHRVLRVAVGVPLFVTGGLLFVGGRALHSVSTGTGGSDLLYVVAAVVSLTGAVAMLVGVVAACVRAPGVPADAPAVPVG